MINSDGDYYVNNYVNAADPKYELGEVKSSCKIPEKVAKLFNLLQNNEIDTVELYGRKYKELVGGLTRNMVCKPFSMYPYIYTVENNLRGLQMELKDFKYLKVDNIKQIKIYKSLVERHPLYEKYKYGINYNENLTYNNQIVLYTAIGDVRGGTVEDGVIIDKNFVENGPRHLVSTTFNLRFTTDTTNTVSKDRALDLKYVKYNMINSDKIIFGMLISNQPLVFVRKVRNIRVIKTIINKIYYYTLYTDNYPNTPKKISSWCVNENGKNGKFKKTTSKRFLVLNYNYESKLSYGTKFANLHGQKGVVCGIEDLSEYKAWTRSGKCIHPQILFSPQSLLGRTTASQVREMHSGDFGWDENGMLVAPLAYNIHYINPGTKARIATPKSDLMTNENGFHANGLHMLNDALNRQVINNRKLDAIQIITELYRCDGVNFKFINDDNNKYCVDFANSTFIDDDDDNANSDDNDDENGESVTDDEIDDNDEEVTDDEYDESAGDLGGACANDDNESGDDSRSDLDE